MPIFFSCPSCNRRGSLPDTFKGGRVTCPQCNTATVIPTAGKPKPPATPTPKPKAAPAAKPKVARPAVLDDFDEEEAPAAAAPSRSSGARSAAQPKSSVPIILGVGGGIASLLLIVIVLLIARGSGEKPAPERQVAAAAPVVEEDSTPAVAATTSAPPVAQVTPPSYAPTESPNETIRRVKDATVYIKVKDAKGQGTGSGFVIQAEGDSVIVATNRHVVGHGDEGEGDGDEDKKKEDSSGKPAPGATVSVVFRSGEGPGQEQELPAQILAKDSTNDTSRDLAILSVKGVTRPPKPIVLSHSGQPSEGMELRIYGFPFGQTLNVASKGNPAITVNKASVSSLRRDDRGNLALIQVDGSVHPGNSGGPIVDDRGQLIGVTVAKLSMADGVGLAIPAPNLEEILSGRVGKYTVERVSSEAGRNEFQAQIHLDDPMGRLKSARLLIAPSTGDPAKPAPAPSADGPIPNSQSFPLTLTSGLKTATAKFAVALPGPTKQVSVQIHYVGGDGKNRLTAPQVFQLPNGTGRLVALGERDPGLADLIRKTLGKLGPLLDPEKDCSMVRDDKGVKITVPGKLHTLAPQIKDRKGKSIKNAPMTLAQVEGDFLVHVRVAGDIRPGIDSVTHPGTGKKLPITFQGAGVVLWQDKDNYIRLERTCGTAGGPTLVTRLLVEVCKDGQEAGRPYYINVPSGPMSLMMIRKDGHIRCLFGNDGKQWAILQEIAAEFPDKIQVGLHGVNISKKPFVAQFEDFALIEDKDKIAQQFKAQ